MKTFLLVVMSVIVSVNAYANSNWVHIITNVEVDFFSSTIIQYKRVAIQKHIGLKVILYKEASEEI